MIGARPECGWLVAVGPEVGEAVVGDVVATAVGELAELGVGVPSVGSQARAAAARMPSATNALSFNRMFAQDLNSGVCIKRHDT